MGCPKWEESGLLYSAHELGEKEVSEYEMHLAGCADCKAELAWYVGGRERFFSPDILGEAPSEKVDREIMRVCLDGRKKVAGGFNLMVAFRKALLPGAIFAMAFVTVGYFTLNIQNARQIARLTAQKQTTQVAAQPAPVAAPIASARVAADSAIDSAHKTDASFAGRRGNLEDNGVVPVNLRK